jgi:hypothetical protein
MRELAGAKLLYLKAALLLLIGVTSATLLVAEQPQIRTLILIAIMIWSFSRAYYFAFYVVEKYVDSSFRFSGLLAFVRYVWRRERGD